MPNPSPSKSIANLRPDIQGMFEEFDVEMNLQRMVALKVFPVFEVGLQAGPFGKIKIESLLRAVDTKRGSGGGYNTSSFEFTDDSYATKENGLTVPVDQRNAKIYANYFQAEVVAAKLARAGVMTNMERRVADLLFKASNVTVNAANEWNTASGLPIDNVETAVQKLYDKGIIANAMLISYKVFRNLRNNAQVIARITASGAGRPAKPSDVTIDMLKAVFDLDNILVGGAQYNSAAEGKDASISPIWSDEYALVTRVSDGDISDPGVGRTFHWGEDGSTIGGTLETYYDEDIRGDKVRCRMETQEKVVYQEAIELIDNVTS
jgi:hypothetical protein